MTTKEITPKSQPGDQAYFLTSLIAQLMQSNAKIDWQKVADENSLKLDTAKMRYQRLKKKLAAEGRLSSSPTEDTEDKEYDRKEKSGGCGNANKKRKVEETEEQNIMQKGDGPEIDEMNGNKLKEEEESGVGQSEEAAITTAAAPSGGKSAKGVRKGRKGKIGDCDGTAAAMKRGSTRGKGKKNAGNKEKIKEENGGQDDVTGLPAPPLERDEEEEEAVRNENREGNNAGDVGDMEAEEASVKE